jgi:GNAT superfamily N-acetyltransferase
MMQASQPQLFNLRSIKPEHYPMLHQFDNLIRSERQPDDPPIPFDEYTADLQNLPEFVDGMVMFLQVSGEARVAGKANAFVYRTIDNQHACFFELEVLPEFRRQGLGRKLLRLVFNFTRQENKRLMFTNTSDRVPAGERFMEQIGAQRGLENHTNQLALQDVDHNLLQDWLAKSQNNLPRFTMGLWDGPYPEEQLQTICDLFSVMNQAPKDDLEIEDVVMLPEELRQMEKSQSARGTQRWTLYIQESATGRFAGFTEVFWNPNRPHLLSQGATGVFPEFRGQGLGRWLKAAMLQKVIAERPQVNFIRTGNANSNAPMLKINTELGFKPYQSNCVWQVETNQVEAYLRSRSA